ncbi:hypothetical protein MCOR07_011561 [Pyricularia oryzae]|uniref:Secreted protein n=5 Tax=Pyricularia TaxID=48558 RepID=A0ABQ8NTK9_PYRGI|nr:uncharacterized protein MGG_15592 [Pyricularia oryzae 70-15]ELQ42167.1 hypothetical protein OOU_Y34scaffold00228g58 [Pyricularia oryzae Y34]KAH8837237.1 hypothetical protein MCOR01_010873 [Pyricularia oryzae]KAI6301973.1 hypothetical protein MCOR33_002595 [Pyricularia grisea]EHA54037.1 hypothetical protein MGG_15592 [Pyricularia oryzae 70-15]KAI6327579.1 hypothetical protein MCOR30_006238 [Pyricularia oryzae]
MLPCIWCVMMNEPAAPCIFSCTLQQLALILIGGSANRSADTKNSSIIVSKFPSRLVAMSHTVQLQFIQN